MEYKCGLLNIGSVFFFFVFFWVFDCSFLDVSIVLYHNNESF